MDELWKSSINENGRFPKFAKEATERLVHVKLHQENVIPTLEEITDFLTNKKIPFKQETVRKYWLDQLRRYHDDLKDRAFTKDGKVKKKFEKRIGAEKTQQLYVAVKAVIEANGG